MIMGANIFHINYHSGLMHMPANRFSYHMLKNLGSKKVWQKGWFATIGEKNFGEC